MIVPSPRSAFLKVSNIPTENPLMQVRSICSTEVISFVLCPFPAMSCHRAKRTLAGQTDTSPNRTYFLALEPRLQGQNQPYKEFQNLVTHMIHPRLSLPPHRLYPKFFLCISDERFVPYSDTLRWVIWHKHNRGMCFDNRHR